LVFLSELLDSSSNGIQSQKQCSFVSGIGLSMSQSKMEFSTSGVVNLLLERYGPYAFGIVSLLVVWLAIVKPELAARTIDFERQQLLIEQMQQVSESMRTTAVILDNTARSLEEMRDK